MQRAHPKHIKRVTQVAEFNPPYSHLPYLDDVKKVLNLDLELAAQVGLKLPLLTSLCQDLQCLQLGGAEGRGAAWGALAAEAPRRVADLP